MAYYPELENEDELDSAAPVSTIAGPQTTRDQVMSRISQVRNSSGDETGAQTDRAAMEFARNSAMTAGLGRAANALAQGTGFKADNSGYDAMERQATTIAEKDMDRSAQVRKAIEDRKARMAMADMANKYRQDDLNERKRHNRAMEYNASQLSGMKIGKNHDIDALPAEDAEVVKDLAKKNASKISIANQIKAVVEKWDELPEDQKVAQGRQLLKVLNSTEGADAIGAEEAKRLGGKLEFAMGNLFNSNPMQFGRDLPGFKTQAAETEASIRDAIRANDAEVNSRYRRHGIARVDAPEPEKKQFAKTPDASGLVTKAKASSGRVKIKVNGKIGTIDLKHLPEALEEGAEVVK